jgi:hypothetical protein
MRAKCCPVGGGMGSVNDPRSGARVSIVRSPERAYQPAATASCCGWHGLETTFVLVRDGTCLLALTDPHGTWVKWLS